MSGEPVLTFYIFAFFIAAILACGSYCILVTRNMIRAIIGLELLIKAVTFLLIYAGYITGQMALAQSFVITMIVIEVVVVAIAGGVSLRVFRHNNDLDVRKLKKLRG